MRCIHARSHRSTNLARTEIAIPPVRPRLAKGHYTKWGHIRGTFHNLYHFSFRS